MAERGKALSITISAGSNQRVKSGSGSLYSVHGFIPNGGSVKLEDTLDLGATPNLNSVASNTTKGYYGPVTAAGPFAVTFGPGTGFDTGLTVAATSNARFTVIYE